MVFFRRELLVLLTQIILSTTLEEKVPPGRACLKCQKFSHLFPTDILQLFR